MAVYAVAIFLMHPALETTGKPGFSICWVVLASLQARE
jgi:hypothetical protein